MPGGQRAETSRPSWNVIKYQRYTSKLYATLGEEVDYPINYHVTGSIRLAHRQERNGGIRPCALDGTGPRAIEFEVIGPNEDQGTSIRSIELDDIQGGPLGFRSTAIIDPSQLTAKAFAKGRQGQGARGVAALQPGEGDPARSRNGRSGELETKNGHRDRGDRGQCRRLSRPARVAADGRPIPADHLDAASVSGDGARFLSSRT